MRPGARLAAAQDTVKAVRLGLRAAYGPSLTRLRSLPPEQLDDSDENPGWLRLIWSITLVHDESV
jgi:hypothetical protein